jgi:hypothetical protein
VSPDENRCLFVGSHFLQSESNSEFKFWSDSTKTLTFVKLICKSFFTDCHTYLQLPLKTIYIEKCVSSVYSLKNYMKI